MSDPRRAITNLSFNGVAVNTPLAPYLESVTYVDVADGSSDEIQIELQDSDLIWMQAWAPSKGDLVTGSFQFWNWNGDGQSFTIECGEFTMDELKYTGGPRTVTMKAVAVPAANNFRIMDRTKTWKKATVRKILRQVMRRYKMAYSYLAGAVRVSKLEQSEKPDCSFLFELCKKFGLGMKVFRNRVIIYDKGAYEKHASVATLTPNDFINDSWGYSSDINGMYTGCKIIYKTTKKKKKKKKNLTAYVGIQGETSPGSRVKKVNQQCSTVKEARQIAAAEVNKANEELETLTGEIWANPTICAASCVDLAGFGKYDGHYFVDKVETTIDANGARQTLEMHRAQTRVTASKKGKKKK